jgi:hypothetical protein
MNMVEDRATAEHEDELTVALYRAARTGELLDLAPDVADADLHPTESSTWPPSRHVPAEMLRAVLVDSSLAPDPRGLRLRGARITGTLDLAHVEVPCPLVIFSSHFTARATFEYATVPALSLERCHIAGLKLAGVRIHGDAVLNGLTVTGEIYAVGAHISGAFRLIQAVLTNEGKRALSLDGARIEGGAFLDGLTTTGEVRAIGARINGQLSMKQAILANDGQGALVLDRAHIDGSASLNGLNARGEVRAIGAHINGQLRLRQATLINASERVLSIDRAHVDGGAFFNGLSATGEVRAVGAQINGQLMLQKAIVTNEGGTALLFDRARIDGSASLSGLTALGEVHVVGAQISGVLGLSGANLSNKDGRALNMKYSLIGRLNMQGLSVKGTLDLAGVQIGDLIVDDRFDAEVMPGPLVASGWRIQDIHGAIRGSRRASARWLDTAPSFVAQPWHELATVYDRNGQPADARWVRWQAARRSTRQAPSWSKPLRWVYGALTGHGYYPLIAVMWLCLTFTSAWLLTAHHTEAFTPTNPREANPATASTVTTSNTSAGRSSGKARPSQPMPTGPITGATPGYNLAPGYPSFHPALHALDGMLPAAATGQASAWRLTSTTWLPWALTTLKAFGWILTVLLLAGVSGLLRRT